MSSDEPVCRTEIGHAYAGQSWTRGLFTGHMAVAGLQIVAQDLLTDARLKGITEPEAVELWENDTAKGFFVGDTAALANEGWTKVATL